VIALEIVTPERLVFAEQVDEVVLPGTEGYLGVLPGHAPLLTRLDTGRIEYKKSGKTGYLAVSGGFVEVLRDRVIVLAEICERAEEIDLDRAREEKRRAEELLKRVDPSDVGFRDAQASFRKALVRMELSRPKSGD
jgi:F-type H+-transporting ATPase subunit epsilon